VARFIAAQGVEHGIPHATACRALGVSPAWFYKWRDGDSSPRHARRAQLSAAIGQIFAARHGKYGSPRITDDLREAGWRVSEKTVAAIMREQHLVARAKKRRKHTTGQGKARWRAPDLVGRDFPASAVNQKWYGDGTEIVTDEGKLFLDSVLDMGSRRLVGFAMGSHHDAELAHAALAMAVAIRGGKDAIAGVIMHTDQGSEYTARIFRTACDRDGHQTVDGPGRVGPRQRGHRIVALDADLRAARSGALRHQGSGSRPGRRLDRRVQPRQQTLLDRHAQPDRLRAHAARRQPAAHREGGRGMTPLPAPR
jgi:putative transposase